MAAADRRETQQPTKFAAKNNKIYKRMNAAGGGRRATIATTQQSTKVTMIIIFVVFTVSISSKRNTLKQTLKLHHIVDRDVN